MNVNGYAKIYKSIENPIQVHFDPIDLTQLGQIDSIFEK